MNPLQIGQFIHASRLCDVSPFIMADIKGPGPISERTPTTEHLNKGKSLSVCAHIIKVHDSIFSVYSDPFSSL